MSEIQNDINQVEAKIKERQREIDRQKGGLAGAEAKLKEAERVVKRINESVAKMEKDKEEEQRRLALMAQKLATEVQAARK